jgi:predicted nucleotidyltransferase
MVNKILLQDEREEIINIIKSCSLQSKAIIFGSRVDGTAIDGSDLDLAIEFYNDDSETTEIFGQLKDKFSESSLPYFIDLHIWNNLPEQMKKNILNNKYEILYQGIDKSAIEEINKKFSQLLKERIKEDGEENFWKTHFILIKLLSNYIPQIETGIHFLKKDKYPQSGRFALIAMCGAVYQIVQILCGLNGGKIQQFIEQIKTDYENQKQSIENLKWQENYKNFVRNEIDSYFKFLQILEKFQEIYNINTNIIRHPKPLGEYLWIFNQEQSEQHLDLLESAEYLLETTQRFYDDNFCPSGFEDQVKHREYLLKIAEEHNKNN